MSRPAGRPDPVGDGPRLRGDDPGRAERLAAAERRLSVVTRVMDDAVEIPGTGRRVGVEPIVGLIPGAGDLVSAGIGVWLIAEAARFRLPPTVIARMLLNTSLDFVVGLVPLLGDVFDFVFKSNRRNLELFRRYASDPGASTTEHRLVLLGVLAVFLGFAWLMLAAIGELIRLLTTVL